MIGGRQSAAVLGKGQVDSGFGSCGRKNDRKRSGLHFREKQIIILQRRRRIARIRQVPHFSGGVLMGAESPRNFSAALPLQGGGPMPCACKEYAKL